MSGSPSWDLSLAMKLPKSSIARVAAAFASANLGDPRRNKRVLQTVSKLAKRPMASLPEAMQTDAELEGAYRLANNRQIEPQSLFDSLAVSAAERAKIAGAVLVIHDTTTCTFGQAEPAEVGYLSTGKAGFLALRRKPGKRKSRKRGSSGPRTENHGPRRHPGQARFARRHKGAPGHRLRAAVERQVRRQAELSGATVAENPRRARPSFANGRLLACRISCRCAGAARFQPFPTSDEERVFDAFGQSPDALLLIQRLKRRVQQGGELRRQSGKKE